jgi:cobalamin-dependent methionine synthase I
MNKRIRELAEQAEWPDDAAPHHMWQVVGTEFAEKFAELIIRECINLAQEAQRNHDDADHHIQQHFGVE